MAESNAVVPFEELGVVFHADNGNERVGDCPFCGKERHFYVNKDTTLYSCKRCSAEGNVYTFYQKMCEEAAKSKLDELATDRALPVSALRRWGVGRLGKMFTIPVRSIKGSVADVRTYVIGRGGVWSLKGTPGVGLLGADGLSNIKRKNEPVFVCEGEWDAMALEFLLRKVGKPGIVVGVPGANTFKDAWRSWFSGRDVVLCYDNDVAGDDGSARASKKVAAYARSIRYLCWPDSLDEGFDVRDLVKKAITQKKLPQAWSLFVSLIKKTHRRAESGAVSKIGVAADPARVVGAESSVDPERQTSSKPAKKVYLKDIEREYGKRFLMTPDMMDSLKIMLSVVVSNAIPGDPLWMFIVAPPGSGKTMLLNTLGGSDECVFRSSVTPHSLVSGFRADTDPSLIPQLDGKVFVLKDYTEVLGMVYVAQEELYSILRGAYDGKVEKSYGNGITRSYESHFSMLAGVTTKIHGNHQATLGERFLKFQIYKKTAYNADDQIRAALSTVSKEARNEEELKLLARDFISRTAAEARGFTDKKIEQMVPPWAIERLIALAQIIAMLRAEVERDVYKDTLKRKPQHEMGTRLAKQLKKLAMSLCVVYGVEKVTEEIYSLVERVAFDTSIGFHLDIVQALIEMKGRAGRDELSKITRLPITNITRHLEDMMLLRVVSKSEAGHTSLGRGVKYEYLLSPRISKLWQRAEVGRSLEVLKYRKFKERNKHGQSHPSKSSETAGASDR